MAIVKPFSIISKRLFWLSDNFYDHFCVLLCDLCLWTQNHMMPGFRHKNRNKLIGNGGTCSPWTAEPAGRHWPCCSADCRASQPTHLACWERLRYRLTSFGDAGNTTREPWTTSFIHRQGHGLTDLWLCLIHLLDNLRSENKRKRSQLTSTVGNYCCWMRVMMAIEFAIE